MATIDLTQGELSSLLYGLKLIGDNVTACVDLLDDMAEEVETEREAALTYAMSESIKTLNRDVQPLIDALRPLCKRMDEVQ